MQRPPKSNNHRPPVKDKPAARVENSAGGVVFRRTRHGLLIGLIMDSYRKWAFPKGRIQKDEDLGAAALRETREEMGLVRLRLVAPLGTASIWFKDRYEQPGTTVHKYISYFLMETAPDEKGKAENKKTGERVRAIRWVPYHRALKEASYKNTLPILKKAIALLEKEAIAKN